MARAHRDSGERGERIADWYLVSRGCSVIRRRVRAGPDEIDLDIDDHGQRVAVEVKYTDRADVEPLDGVDDAKLERIRRASSLLAPGFGRIDLVGVAARHRHLEVRWLVGVQPLRG